MYTAYIVKRTQIYLDDDQAARVGRRAGVEGTTKSAVIRRAIDAYLDGDGAERRLHAFRRTVQDVAGSVPRLEADYVETLRTADVDRDAELESRRRRR